MPKVKISHLEKNTFIYEIDVATRWGKWHLEKKYVEFQDLHKILNSEFNDLPEVIMQRFSFHKVSLITSSDRPKTRHQNINKSYNYICNKHPNEKI